MDTDGVAGVAGLGFSRPAKHLTESETAKSPAEPAATRAIVSPSTRFRAALSELMSHGLDMGLHLHEIEPLLMAEVEFCRDVPGGELSLPLRDGS